MPVYAAYEGADCGPRALKCALEYHTRSHNVTLHLNVLARALKTTRGGTLTADMVRVSKKLTAWAQLSVNSGKHLKIDEIVQWLANDKRSVIASYIDEDGDWHYQHFVGSKSLRLISPGSIDFVEIKKVLHDTDSLIFLDSSDNRHLTEMAEIAKMRVPILEKIY